MPRFYVNFQNDSMLARDDTGTELPGLEEAKASALASAREILADDIKNNSSDPLRAVMVADESGNELWRLSAKDILPESLK
jgi:uncharacterized protein DUF6894